MKCPACGKRIYVIQRGFEEYICINDECPANNGGPQTEWYGTQEQINKMYRGSASTIQSSTVKETKK